MSAEAFLLTLPRFAAVGSVAMKPGLGRIAALLDGMGRPQDAYPSVLVAGTNGKGSVASMLAAIATAAGTKVGLHTSPHLLTLRERMRIDGRIVPQEWLDTAVEQHRRLFQQVEPSFFEATVALSLLYFASLEVDLAVVEVGLGGRLDATNVLEPRLSLVTRIALDHQELLGDTPELIAREKAGIARREVPFLTSQERGPALDALMEVASARGARVEAVRETVVVGVQDIGRRTLVLDVRTPSTQYADLQIGLTGAHQAWNAALAVRAAEHLLDGRGDEEREVAIRRGLAGVISMAGLTGRCQVVSEKPLIMIDVAHNPDGLAATLTTLRELATGQKTVILGLMRDKNPSEVARLLAKADLRIAPVDLEGDRAVGKKELRDHLLTAGANVVDANDVSEVARRFLTEAAPRDALLATGSHQVVAQAIAALNRELTRA
jgi:dihydrofolate synthase / folylpolyglutamate synthase